MAVSWTIAKAEPHERISALALAIDRSREHCSELLATGRFDPRGLFVLRDQHQVRAAFACQPMPGGTALVWCPRGEFAVEEVDALVSAGIEYLKANGVKVAETIVRPEEVASLSPLARRGFTAVGPMLFLRRDLHDHHDQPELTINLVPFESVDPALFTQTLDQTYDGTLDFPELTGTRSLDEIMTGYRTNPDARPDRWWLAQRDDGPAGILMLCEVVPLEAWDLTYLGVIRSHRRRGLGRQLVAAAIDVVHQHGGTCLGVAVDARNAPAIQLYLGLGFQLVGERLVSLAFLSPNREISTPY